MLLVPAEITDVRVTSGDITALTINTASSNVTVTSDITAVSIQSTDTTVMTAAPATINLATLSFSTSAPADVTRTASVGVSNLAARADHVHSAANLLMDGGNY